MLTPEYLHGEQYNIQYRGITYDDSTQLNMCISQAPCVCLKRSAGITLIEVRNQATCQKCLRQKSQDQLVNSNVNMSDYKYRTVNVLARRTTVTDSDKIAMG